MGWWRDAKKRLKGVGKRGNGVGSGTIVGEDVRSGWGGSGVKSGARGGKKRVREEGSEKCNRAEVRRGDSIVPS